MKIFEDAIIGTPDVDNVSIRTHLFRIDSFQVEWFLPLLSRDEKSKAERFHFVADAERSIISRGILRCLLSAFIDVPPDEIRFAYTENNKPLIHPCQNSERFNFNLSHSAGRILTGICKDNAVGVDIEEKKEIDGMDNIIRKYSDGGTYTQYSEQDREDKITFFYSWWTRTEAYLKAKGSGLSGMDEYDFNDSKYSETVDTGDYIYSLCVLKE